MRKTTYILALLSLLKPNFRHLFKDPLVLSATIWIFLWIIVALLAPIIANDKPLYCKIGDQSFFPIFQHTANKITVKTPTDSTYTVPVLGQKWREVSFQYAIWPLIPHGPTLNSRIIRAQSPFEKQFIKDQSRNKIPLSIRERHWLGTTHDNRDVLAVLIHGSRRSFYFSLLVAFLASSIGIFWGSIAGFWGDTELSVPRRIVLFLVLGVPIALFYGWYIRWYVLIDSWSISLLAFLSHMLLSFFISGAIIFISLKFSTLWKGWSFMNTKIAIPIDQFVLRVIEILNSIPIIILFIIIGAIVAENLTAFIFIASLIAWPSFARLIRGEILMVKSLPYIEAGRGLGFSRLYVLFVHVLPNALPNMWVTIFISIGNLILFEAAISFLGIGISSDIPSWGEIIFSARQQNMSLWWLAVFPGLIITFTVLSFNIWGEKLRDMLDPHEKI